MKPKQAKNYQQSGFTLIELLVVISIMTLITGLLVLDFNGQRAARNIVLAQNETATNLRKVQSYTLSSRDITPGVGAKFYVMTFNADDSSYTTQAVDNQYVFHDSLETVNLPTGATITSLNVGGTAYRCIQVIFSAPFGTMYVYGSSHCDSSIAGILKDPVQLAALSQSVSYIYLFGNSSNPNAKYIKLSPLSGQVATN